MSFDQATLAVLKRKQAALVSSGDPDGAAEVDDEIALLRGDGPAKKIRKRAAAEAVETAKDAAVSDETVVEKAASKFA
jgi:hypothetical protein